MSTEYKVHHSPGSVHCSPSSVHYSPNSLQNIPPLQKGTRSTLDIQTVRASLNLFPEIQALEKKFDGVLHARHTNSNMPKIETFFREVLQLNPQFKKQTIAERAQLLFNVYVHKVMLEIEEMEEFKQAFAKISKITPNKQDALEVIEDYILWRIQNLHTSSVTYVLSQVLESRERGPSVTQFKRIGEDIHIPKYPD